MTHDEAYAALHAHLKTTGALEQVAEILSWDQEVMMPEKGDAQRTEQMGALEQVLHARRGDARMSDWLAAIDDTKLDQAGRVNVAEARKALHRAQRVPSDLAEALAKTDPNGAIWANQFDNVANRQAHIDTTAPEIFQQTQGKVDGFVCAVGSGGTLAGVATGLRALKPGVKIALADPEGAALYSYYTTGEMKSEGNSITEGIGQGRITANLEGLAVDLAYRIPDKEALPIVFDLLAEEGLCLGGSSGINIAGAMHMAREMGPGHVIVTVLCDYGTRYQSKLFNPDFLRSKDLPVPAWLDRAPADVPDVTVYD